MTPASPRGRNGAFGDGSFGVPRGWSEISLGDLSGFLSDIYGIRKDGLKSNSSWFSGAHGLYVLDRSFSLD
jgi:hypothetical protein